MTTTQASNSSYPISEHIDITFSPFEDRLVITAKRKGIDPVVLLCSRRMTILVLQQLLANLPNLTGLDKTPSVYWQEVLQMAHQKAMQVKQAADEQAAWQMDSTPPAVSKGMAPSVKSGPDTQPNDVGADHQAAPAPLLFLATELTAQRGSDTLTLAFKGLPMPDAMLHPRQHEPVFAIPLQTDNVHQLIELLISKCQEAQWHLPLELPWLQAADQQPPPAQGLSRSH